MENNSKENTQFSEEDFREEELKILAGIIAKNRDEHKEKLEEFNAEDEKLFKIFHDTLGGDKDLHLLFHRLNYQRVVDKMNKDVKWWKWSVLGFALLAAFGLYFYGNMGEHIITKNHGLDDYEQMISSVDFEINYEKELTEIFPYRDENDRIDFTKPEKKIESLRRVKKPNYQILADVSETFFNMYFMKYLLIRFLLIAVLITLITSGIKVYMRMRKDRMGFIIKEEATTTTLYLFKKFLSKSSNNDYSARDKEFIEGMLPKIIDELYYLPNSRDLKNNDFSMTHKVIDFMEKMTTNIPRK